MALSIAEWEKARLELARTRERCGSSQSEVARVAGVSASLISQIESGERQPTERVLRAYARECNLDVVNLLFQWHRMPSDWFTEMHQNLEKREAVRRELALQG